MGTTHRSPSEIWDKAIKKLFSKRSSKTKSDDSRNTFNSMESSTASEHTDGFYMYSQTQLDQEDQKQKALQLRSSDSTEASYLSALMAPERPAVPYTISSPSWNRYSESVKYIDGPRDENAADCLHSVLSVFSTVYSMTKVFVTILLHYGIELEDMHNGILHHIARAEEVVISDSIAELIDVAEGLYYALYARLIMEMANAELCSSFHLNVHSMASNDAFSLPEPGHLVKIMLFCKEMLESPSICHTFNKALVQQHQESFVRRAVDKSIGVGFFLDDLLGYRRYILDIAADRSSAFYEKWSSDITVYSMPPEEILTTLSEKYLTFTPKIAFRDEIPLSELPFVNLETVDPETWELELIKDHRQATLAKLEGKCVGDIRREDNRRRLSDYMKEKKCICRWSCTCSWDCTLDPERACPCAERLMRIMLAKRRKGTGSHDFGSRCSSLAKAVFQGVASIKRDVDEFEIALELDRALLLFADEIQKQRIAAAKANGIEVAEC